MLRLSEFDYTLLCAVRHGLFIIGNMSKLAAKSETWKKIQTKLSNRDEIGTSLTIEWYFRDHFVVHNLCEASLKFCHKFCISVKYMERYQMSAPISSFKAMLRRVDVPM